MNILRIVAVLRVTICRTVSCSRMV